MYQMNAVATPTVAWPRPYLIQGKGYTCPAAQLGTVIRGKTRIYVDPRAWPPPAATEPIPWDAWVSAATDGGGGGEGGVLGVVHCNAEGGRNAEGGNHIATSVVATGAVLCQRHSIIRWAKTSFL